MRFDEFIGNRAVVDRLRVKLHEARFPHGVIFSGPEGVGKRTFALMTAKALNCREAASDEFCNRCEQCRKVDAGSHPDILRIGLEEDASEIKIAQIRELLRTLELRPLEGTNKVFIIDPANAMNPSASNALLKGLEEPPENTHFVLLTSNFQELLVTVRSRCQHYAFTPLSTEEMRRFGCDELAMRWARGSIGALKTIDLEQLRRRREAVLGFLETAIGAREDHFRDLIAESADLARSKSEFESHLDAISVLLGDVLYLREGAPEAVVNDDIRDRLAKLAADLPVSQILRIADFLRTVEIHSNNYGNRQMLTDGLALTSNAVLEKIANDNARKSR